jgi:serine phosphatase RsbU (regulator of sigma subunit)
MVGTTAVKVRRRSVTEPVIDYEAVFQALPGMVALLTPGLIYADANEAFLRGSGRTRDQVVGRYLFDVFPDNPGDSGASGGRNLSASLRRVLETGVRDTMAVQRYDVEDADRPGLWRERYWSPVNCPVLDADGNVVLVVHRVEDVTELIRARRRGAEHGGLGSLEADLYLRARELQDVNERLRRAHAREREVGLALQEALLPPPHPVGRLRAAVRYRPAAGALNVCGDWYDLVDLPGGRIAVTVGDVVGHGLAAACVMGQMRSALSAACLSAAGPAQALDVLDLYARQVDDAQSTTAVTAFIDWESSTLTYSRAGHPPPAVLRADGTVVFLDQATEPPLGARPEHRSRVQAAGCFGAGDTLVLYTDGLVERRREDIDAGLARLAGQLARHRGVDPEALADALLDLLPADGATDDTALVVLSI